MKISGETKSTALLPRECLKCGYDLRGLAEPCECPECGRACEASQYVWHNGFLTAGPKGKCTWLLKLSLALLGLAIASALVAIAFIWWQWPSTVAMERVRYLFGFARFCAQWSIVFLPLGILSSRGRRVIVNRDSLRPGPYKYPFWRWDQIEKAETVRNKEDRCVVYLKTYFLPAFLRSTDATCSLRKHRIDGFQSRESMLAFVDVVNRYARQYRAHAPKTEAIDGVGSESDAVPSPPPEAWPAQSAQGLSSSTARARNTSAALPVASSA